MKKILLKKVKVILGVDSESLELDYLQQYQQALLAPRESEGATYAEMVEIIPIAAKLSAAIGKDYVLLEDAEHFVLCERLQNTKYRINSAEIFDMLENFIKAPSHLVEG